MASKGSRRAASVTVLVVLVGGLLAGCELPAQVLSGQLLIAGSSTPAAGATVQVYDDTTETVVAQTVAGANGRYAFTTAQLPDGGYRIRLSPTEWWQDADDWADATVVAVSDESPAVVDADITLVTGSLTGTVTDGTTGVEGASVQAVSTTTGAAIASTTTGAGGAFAFDELAIGTYRLHLTATGYATTDPPTTHTVSEDLATDAGTIALSPDAVLTGIVTDGGAPASGVVVITQLPVTGALISTTTDANGAFAFRGLGAAPHPIILAEVTPTLRLVSANDSGTPTLFTPEPGEHLHTGTIDLETGATTPMAFSSFDEGYFHACAIDADDQSLACWGANYYGQTSAPTGAFTKVSLALDTVCAIRTDGTLVCRGTDEQGSGGVTPPTGTFDDVHVGGSGFSTQLCGIDDTGQILCVVGAGTASPAAGTFSALGTGSDLLTCAIRTEQTVACWGSNTYGQATPPPGTFRQVTNGVQHACGIATDRALTCWGGNHFGQTDAPAGEFLEVSAGRVHTCALTSGLQVRCWGDDTRGQLNTPEGAFVRVTANRDRTCAVSAAGSVVCWGDPDTGTESPSREPVTTVTANYQSVCTLDAEGIASCWGFGAEGASTGAPPGAFTELASNWRDYCGITEAGALSCWGSYSPGPPTPPPGSFTTVDAGDDHWCAVSTDGTVACWGSNTSGKATPLPGTYTEVNAGPQHTCAIATDGTLACWGDNSSGEASPPPGTYTDVASGTSHSCAISDAGTISCWGSSTGGRTAAPSGTFVDVEIAGSSSCAVSTDGSIRCWGPPFFAPYGTPAPPSSGTYTALSSSTGESSRSSFCALRSDGAYQCWGSTSVVGWLYD